MLGAETMRVLPLGNLIRHAAPLLAGRGDYPVLSVTMRGGLVDQADKFKKRIASKDTASYKVVKRGDLVVGFPIDEGVLSFQDLYDNAIVSPAYDVWELRASVQVSSEYLESYLRSEASLAYYRSRMRGSTARRRTIPDDLFLALPVPLPMIEEQLRIVEILRAAQSLRLKAAQATELSKSFIQSAFNEYFGDLSANAKGWKLVQMAEISAGTLRNGLSPATEGLFKGSVLTLGAVTSGRFIASCLKDATFSVRPRQDQLMKSCPFLICRGSGSKHLVGMGAYCEGIEPSAVFPDTMIGMNPSGLVLPGFFQFLWNSPFMRMQIESAARTTNGTYKINQEGIDSISVPLPPLDEQARFVELTSVTDRITRKNLALTERAKDLSESISSRLLVCEMGAN